MHGVKPMDFEDDLIDKHTCLQVLKASAKAEEGNLYLA